MRSIMLKNPLFVLCIGFMGATILFGEKLYELTVAKIMQDPKWIGISPSANSIIKPWNGSDYSCRS